MAAKGNVMRDADDTPLRIVGTLMDVSARKQTEQELRREALLFESLNDGVIFLDLQGNVVDWNSSAERLFGYSKGEVLGRTWSDVLKLSEHNLQATVLAALKRYGRWSREVVALPEGRLGDVLRGDGGPAPRRGGAPHRHHRRAP